MKDDKNLKVFSILTTKRSGTTLRSLLNSTALQSL